MQVAVIGAGMIGLSLCALLTGNGVSSVLYVRDQAESKRQQYRDILKGLEERGFLSGEQAERCESYLTVVTDYQELENSEIVFECATEQYEVKQKIYHLLSRYCKQLKAVASTTSAISSEELAKGSVIREKLLVAHPFYPPHLIPCVEVIPNQYTSSIALKSTLELLEKLNRKVTVLQKDIPGFVANRIQYAMLREAIHIVEEGVATPSQVDDIVMHSFAARYTGIGIFEHFDSCGLDLTKQICQYLYPCLADEKEVQSIIKRRCEDGCYGIKSGQGIYAWDEEQKKQLKERVQKAYDSYFNWKIPNQRKIRNKEADK